MNATLPIGTPCARASTPRQARVSQRLRTLAATAAWLALMGSGTPSFAREELHRGNLPADLINQIQLRTQAQVLVCPAPYKFVSDKFGTYRCAHRITQYSDIRCPADFPRHFGRRAWGISQGLERDVCAKSNLNIRTTRSLADFQVNVHYVLVPFGAVSNGVSFVAADANPSPQDRWQLQTDGNDGITDRYQREVLLLATPLLVNP
jgi:hypothetical protein